MIFMFHTSTGFPIQKKRFLPIFILFWLLPYFPLLAQKDPPSPQWGEVTHAEIDLKVCPFDSAAPAVVLSDYGKIKFGFEVVYIEQYKRVKILDRKGIDEANISILYRTDSRIERISKLQAQVITVGENGQIKKEEVSPKEIFDVKHSETVREKRFGFPNVRVGSILEYRYTMVSENFYTLDDWIFQSHIPTLHSDLLIEKQGVLTYRILLNGRMLTEKYQNQNETAHFSLDNLPALVKESHVVNHMDYAEKINFQLDIYTKTDGVPLESRNHIGFLNEKKLAKELLKTILLGNETEPQRVAKIFNYVKLAIKWNEKHHIFSSQSAKEALENKRGNNADINLLLILLLRESGTKAFPAMISTRENGKIFRSEKPLLFQFDYLLAWAVVDNKEMLLDATDPMRPYNLLAQDHLTEYAFVLDKANPRWVSVSNQRNSRQVISAEVNFTNPTQPLYRFSTRYEGYFALEKRKQYASKGQKALSKEVLSTPYQDFRMANSEVQHTDNPDEAFILNLDYQPESASAGSDMIYFKPILMSDFEHNPFKNEKRTLPVELDYPATYTFILNLKIPEGYQIQEMPQSSMMKFPDNLAEFRYHITQNSTGIQLASTVTFKTHIIPLEYYQHLREFYGHIIAKHQEMLILKKK